MDLFEIIPETKFDLCQWCMKNNEIARETFLILHGPFDRRVSLRLLRLGILKYYQFVRIFSESLL